MSSKLVHSQHSLACILVLCTETVCKSSKRNVSLSKEHCMSTPTLEASIELLSLSFSQTKIFSSSLKSLSVRPEDSKLFCDVQAAHATSPRLSG